MDTADNFFERLAFGSTKGLSVFRMANTNHRLVVSCW